MLFIGFDIVMGKVYGNSGCNCMMGFIDFNLKFGIIDMSWLGSICMVCLDMMIE